MKNEGETGKITGTKVMSMFTGLAAAAVATVLFLAVFAFVLLKSGMSAQVGNIGVICISVLSCFAGGFFCGRKNEKRGFLWGLAVGILYFCLLLPVRMLGGQPMSGQGIHMLTSFLYCTGSGMLGGMLS